MPKLLDVIIPVYNEADNVRPLVLRLDKALSEAKISYHLHFVDDKSSDNTVALLKDLAKKYPLTIHHKKGQRGKAFSILEGALASKAPFLAMIDADLQYPPEAIPEMFRIAQDTGIVVAKRNNYQESPFRHTLSRGFQWLFGKMLHGLDCDVQSGLKLFKREIIENVQPDDVTPWTLDIPLLTTALNLGYTIGGIDITFEKRTQGESKIEFVSSIREIGGQAISYKFKQKKSYTISPDRTGSMIGAGLVHRGKRFVTHTTLRPSSSALDVLSFNQSVFIFLVLLALLVSFIINPLETAKIFVAFLSSIYFLDVIFNFFLIVKSLRRPPELLFDADELAQLDLSKLPIYTVLCPLYREAHVIPQFLAAIERMDWPKEKLDVQLLLEEDDLESIDATKRMKLPKYVRVVVVPHSMPKTKPKACNYGLSLAKGEYVVIYDAEDDPDPQQLKKSYIAFQKVGPNIKCLQAKLNYYNPNQNWLTRLFTAEYSLWFDIILTGLQSIETTIPLGGTSNHFRTADLMMLQGWDPFNVTEDCDLGVRLFNQGFKTAIIDSTTLEEANSNFTNWIRQRSRWIKGYMQTYLLHMREPIKLVKQQGIHALLFQLTVGGKISFILINPILWVLTISYFVLYAYVGPGIEALYPSVIFYMAVSSLIFGNFMFIYYYMIGCAKREHWGLMKWVYIIPFYWLMVSISGVMALYELIVRPHYWQKTIHGLHLKKAAEAVLKESVVEVAAQSQSQPLADRDKLFIPVRGLFQRMDGLQLRIKKLSIKDTVALLKEKQYLGGVLFIAATMIANVVNMVTNIYLGSSLTFDQFGVFSLIVSFLYLVYIPINAFGGSVNYKAGYLFGKFKTPTLFYFWKYIRRRALALGFIASACWLAITPFLPQLLHTPSATPYVVFTVLIGMGLIATVDVSYLTARLEFKGVAVVVLIQPVVRLLSAFLLSKTFPSATYLSITAGLMAAFLAGWWFSKDKQDDLDHKYQFHLPRRFFFASLIAGFSSIAFFSLDNLMVAHLLTTADVGKYSVLGLFGKMIFFVGNLSAGFLAPLVARAEGAGTNSKKIFRLTFLSVAGMTLLGYLVFAVGVYVVGPMYFGSKIAAIRDLLPIYGLGISAFTLSQVIVSYNLVKKNYIFPALGFALSLVEVAALYLFHNSLTEVVMVMTWVGVLYFVILGVFHKLYYQIITPLQNVRDFLELLTTKIIPIQKPSPNHLSILFFNWRDIKHSWAGGAEVYIHELAKQLVKGGHTVTVFCGNDGKSKRTEVVDGITVIRRGGFYTVYVWAAIYYLLRLRKSVDVVIDSENGIPFLTPMYVKKPIFLLVHHVHQEFFRAYLRFPMNIIATFIEGEVMPLLYRNTNIITASESSKTEILKLGLGKPSSIVVINPGINLDEYSVGTKTKHPTISYIGRLKPYKNVDVAVRSFAEVLKKIPKAKMLIAGSGESEPGLRKLVNDLNLKGHVTFLGKISDQDKVKLLASSWIAVQPSMIEGWGITVIEANACGTPVVASRVNGLKDSTRDGETGILVPPQNVEALTTAVLLLLENTKKRKKFATAALKWSSRFSWAQSAATLDILLKDEFDSKQHFYEAIQPSN